MVANGDTDESQESLISDTKKYGSTSQDSSHDDEEAYIENNIHLKPLHSWDIICILSNAFAYGCILTTLFLITLPLECERIQREHPTVPKSVSLGVFVAIAGITQLISPLAGMLSDSYKPPTNDLGQRLPYLVFGAILTVIGLLCQYAFSERSFWIRFTFAFFLHMIGLNIIYSMMIALIPDQVPESQTGMANGTLALLLVTGSLFGFALFHSFLSGDIQSMYGLYTCIVIFTTILSCSYAQDGDVSLSQQRRRYHQLPPLPSTRHPMMVSPTLLLRTMLYDPLRQLEWETFISSYTVDSTKYHDFFMVTVSRTFYYMGISVQTFFMYFIHDIIRVHDNPESAVALLAILGQCAGALTCYPVGLASDRLFGGRRKPFVYLACATLALSMFSLLFCTTMTQVTLIGLVLGGANGMYLTMDTSLAVDTLPKDHGLDGSDTAQLLGVWGVAGFVGSAMGPLIGGPLLYIVGGTDGTDIAEYTIKGYSVIICASSFYFCLSAFILRHVNDEKHVQTET
jgi:MFS family permease